MVPDAIAGAFATAGPSAAGDSAGGATAVALESAADSSRSTGSAVSLVARASPSSCFTSVVLETRERARLICGVITDRDVLARQGDGQNYPPSFKDPLHAGTEFDVLERRPGWLHIRLSDNNDGWIPDNTAELI